MAQRFDLDRGKLQKAGVVALVVGLAGIALLVVDTEQTTTEGVVVFAVVLVVSPILVLVGISSFVFAWLTDPGPKRNAPKSELEVRTQEIVDGAGISWRAAWKLAEAEGADRNVPAHEDLEPPMPDATATDIEERLRELKRLRDAGLIDIDEYQRKQRSLLDGL